MPYSIKVKCRNCSFSEDMEIPEGMRVSEMPCPECKTKSLALAEKEKTNEKEEKPAQI